LLVLASWATSVEPARAATSANANSPLGIDLSGITYWSSEQPFLNIFKTTAITKATPSGWVTHSRTQHNTGEEAYLQLDASGYPTTLKASSADPNSPQKFTSVGRVLLRGLPTPYGGGPVYRPGKYVVLYDGQGTISYGLNAVLVSHSAGRDVIDVAKPTRGGIWLEITSTDPTHDGNYIRNIRLVKAEEEGLLNSGQVFEPYFLHMLENFRVLRFMQWSSIDAAGGMDGTWAGRTHVSDAGWGSVNGVPLEVDVQLANSVGADPWLNVPINADDDYIVQLATLVHNTLNKDMQVYVELSNEVWNRRYAQNGYATNSGLAMWPGNTNGFVANRNWFGMRTAQMCDIWAQVWGNDFSRVHCVLGAQVAATRTATFALNCSLWSGAPCYKHHITDVAIAPYFGWPARQIPASWESLDLTTLVNDIFAEINSGGQIPNGPAGGALENVSRWEAAYKTALAPYNLPFIAYEGGDSLTGFPMYRDGSNIVNAYSAANLDPRMDAAYARALADWKKNGGHVYVTFEDVSKYSQYGEWGTLQSFMDPISPLSRAAPKWRALQNVISANPCWWAGCQGSVTAGVPLPPQDFHAAH